MARSPNLENVSTRLQRIAQLAREDRSRVLVSLAHHIDLDLLREAYRRTRKDGAPGVDGQTAAAYEENLEENLQSLLDRFKSGSYKAPPVRRVYIPKGVDPTKKRPIGVPTFEDKVLQRAVAMVLEAVYEQDFLGCSYGFRPERSAHQAISNLRPDEQLDPSAQEWLLYNLLEGRFLQRKTVRDVANRLAMSESDFYRKQRVAIEEVARQLTLMEEGDR